MSKLKEIIEGHINELRAITGVEDQEKEKVFAIRANICLTCPLKLGNTCNSQKYINPESLDVVSKPKEGYIRGCGCRLSAKQRSPGSECPAGFWKKLI